MFLVPMMVMAANKKGDELCVVGCTPYVDFVDPASGMDKYRALARELAETCAIVVHTGDTKPGQFMGCNATTLTHALHILADEAKVPILLYAPGDNELHDCHRLQSARPGQRIPSEFVKAAEARQFLVDDLRLRSSGYDITGTTPVVSHDSMRRKLNPATCDDTGNHCQPYSCDFDKYLEMDHYAVATLEVIGSYWYLDDERKNGYPFQDQVDPLADRLAMYVNAKDCALDWIDQSAAAANRTGKVALFFLLHASFYAGYGQGPLLSSLAEIGHYYQPDHLERFTLPFNDPPVRQPYAPLYKKFERVALQYPHLQFQIVHSDAHRWSSTRFNPTVNNLPETDPVRSHFNLRIHQTEGASRALTMYTRFTVDPSKFQPITAKEEWSEEAYHLHPFGHAWVPYTAPYQY
ncbi:hypothetical protein ACA910_018923 [Epithemia clementina (nom. ined.)]